MRHSRSLLVIPFWLAFDLAANPAGAKEFELTPNVGYRWGGEVEDSRTVDLEEGAVFGLAFGWRINPEAWFEVLWSHQEAEFDLAPFSQSGEEFGLDVDYLHFGGVYRPTRPAGRIEPFVTFSAGLTYLQPEPSGFGNEEGLSVAVGGGATIPLGRRVGLRLAARGWFTFTDARFSGACGGGACSFDLSGDGMAQFDVTAGVIFRLESSRRGSIR